MTEIIPHHSEEYTYFVTEHDQGLRVDQFIAKQLPLYSRTFIQKLIESQHLSVNNKIVTKSSYVIQSGDTLRLTIPPVQRVEPLPKAQLPTNITLIFENTQFLIICKPPGLAVHRPKPTFKQPTLVDWLVGHFSELETVGYADRPGIVHRLDKDTSGIMIIPRTNYAHMKFSSLFKDRAITKIYLAVVEGHPPRSGTIDFNIVRHPLHRNKMTYSISQGRQALTRYRVLACFEHASLVEVKPVTGRMHQIRVHMAAIGHPLIGDLLYGRKSPYINRQALHASEISFIFDNEEYHFFCALPEDFQELMQRLKRAECQT